MEFLRHINVPTGDILVVNCDNGPLEVLSIGDYGKENNLKCDAIGLTEAPKPVRHGVMLPLEEKWVITMSTQYGCAMGCKFCDVPKVGNGRNATLRDLRTQLDAAMSVHPEVTWSDRINIHFARMGEPTWNPAVIEFTHDIRRNLSRAGKFKIHPVISTMMPKSNRNLGGFLDAWMGYKNIEANGEAGLQLSINSTSDDERTVMFNGNSLPLDVIAEMVSGYRPVGRKITLNFALAGYEIDADKLLRLFNPGHFIVKLTPMHKTNAATDAGIRTEGDYTEYTPYAHIERSLVRAGFDVLVFIASEAEDLGRITCGNAILSGSLPLCDYAELA